MVSLWSHYPMITVIAMRGKKSEIFAEFIYESLLKRNVVLGLFIVLMCSHKRRTITSVLYTASGHLLIPAFFGVTFVLESISFYRLSGVYFPCFLPWNVSGHGSFSTVKGGPAGFYTGHWAILSAVCDLLLCFYLRRSHAGKWEVQTSQSRIGWHLLNS